MTLQDQLSTLFEKDSNVRSLRRRLDAATRRRDHQQEKLDQFETQHGERTDELKKAKAHAATLEGDATESEDRGPEAARSSWRAPATRRRTPRCPSRSTT